MLDLGSAYADWVLATGMYAPRSRLVPIQANAAPFRNMYKHLMVNPGLVDRVHGLNAAVMSNDRFPNEAKSPPLVSDNAWKGPVLCDDGTDKPGVMDTVTTKADSCTTAELRVPIVTIDMVMSAHTRGTLFFMKIDLEGAEYESLRGGNATFSDPDSRPCIVIIELKVNVDKPYKEAFDFMVAKGYTDYEDLDSGITGADSWPPRGLLFGNEGNYEFRLPKELDFCTMQVLRESQQQMMD
ncbi:expressed unknown protein [Seminavis robusta]|uniref:Methyltransferase FkbM domain-containing protein n=1 Tax=Seminavis robusta TaxID=568900 RepID=A0A9N8HX65_9STRA|nr:expressed unknown protein [Seminavis robusta]|eukprot:Sro2137_g316060.1 n/a (240) ;mRNA; r:15781-16500